MRFFAVDRLIGKRAGAPAARTQASGFTLIELLVAISITVLLVGLVMGPVIQTFNMTSRTNAMVQAQDTARITMEQISREVGQAMFVYDNSNSMTSFPVQQPDNTQAVLTALNARVDILLPKLVMHCNNPDHPSDQPREYERGDDAWPPCPYCGSDDVEARPRQPLVGDTKIVRYFIGLADNDPDADPSIMPAPGYRDWQESGAPLNGFVLYRAEFDPEDANLFPEDPASNGRPNLEDPNFFYNKSEAPNGKPFWKNWKLVAKPVVAKAEMDLVKLQMNSANDKILSIIPAVRFQLTRMTNDSFAPSHISDIGSEAPVTIPTLYRATYGSWGTSIGTDNPDPYNVSVVRHTSNGDIWFRTQWDNVNGQSHMVIYKYTNNGGSWSSSQQFDITAYQQSQQFTPADPDIAFVVDPNRGEVRCDFPASDVINKQQISDMNRTVYENFNQEEGAPYREYRLTMFATTPGNTECQRRIVPGSEVVMGPDMTPGVPPGEARMVRYERVPFNLGDPGRNQYKIDYGMNDATGGSVGRIIFSPVFDEVIPETMEGGSDSHFDISYRYQINRDGDIVAGNYSTKTLLTITLGIRYYDRASGKVQPIELTNKIRVRNLMR